MAEVKFSAGIDLITGAVDSNHELISRRKHLHAPDGSVTKECKPEAYYQRNKRNYKQNPPKGAELAHLQHFGDAAKRTTALMQAFRNPGQASEQERALVQQYLGRFYKQLDGPADQQAPTKTDGKQKRYYRFDNFVRAMIFQELKNDWQYIGFISNYMISAKLAAKIRLKFFGIILVQLSMNELYWHKPNRDYVK